MSAPNQTRLRVLASILHLEQFTVADLCHHAGIERSQTYRILSDLKDEGVLESSSTQKAGEIAPRHRPSKRYVLTEDLGIRERIEVELNSFLPDSEEAHENRQLVRAQQGLRSLSMELVSTSFTKMDLNELQGWQSAFDERLQEVQRVLKRAFWESETDFSEGDHSEHPIIRTRLEFQALESRFTELVKAEETRLTEEKVRESWSHLFSEAVARLFPILTAASTAGSDLLLQNSFKLSAKLIRELGKSQRSKEELIFVGKDALRPYLSSLELDLRDAASSSDALAALAKNCIVYGKHADIAYRLCSKLANQNDDYKSVFNYANLAHLAERPNEACESWFRYLELRSKPRNACAMNSLVARIPGNVWSAAAYEEAVQTITRKCNASVSAFSETPFERSEQREIEPKLYNPLFEDLEGESPFISVAEPLAQQKRIYAVTSEAQRPFVIGFPRVVRANLFYCGLSEREAWDLSNDSAEDERIVKVDWFRSATQQNRELAQDILTSKLSATIVGPMITVDQV